MAVGPDCGVRCRGPAGAGRRGPAGATPPPASSAARLYAYGHWAMLVVQAGTCESWWGRIVGCAAGARRGPGAAVRPGLPRLRRPLRHVSMPMGHGRCLWCKVWIVGYLVVLLVIVLVEYNLNLNASGSTTVIMQSQECVSNMMPATTVAISLQLEDQDLLGTRSGSTGSLSTISTSTALPALAWLTAACGIMMLPAFVQRVATARAGP